MPIMKLPNAAEIQVAAVTAASEGMSRRRVSSLTRVSGVAGIGARMGGSAVGMRRGGIMRPAVMRPAVMRPAARKMRGTPAEMLGRSVAASEMPASAAVRPASGTRHYGRCSKQGSKDSNRETRTFTHH